MFVRYKTNPNSFCELRITVIARVNTRHAVDRGLKNCLSKAGDARDTIRSGTERMLKTPFEYPLQIDE